MGDEDPKTKGSEKIKFFEIDREGGIAPAFPQDPAPGAPSENTFSRLEPLLPDPSAAAPSGWTPDAAPPADWGSSPAPATPNAWDAGAAPAWNAPAEAPHPWSDQPMVPTPPPVGAPAPAPMAPPPPAAIPEPAAAVPTDRPLDPLSLPMTFSSEREELMERSELERPLPPSAVDRQVESRADQMKVQVDSIARISERGSLSPDQVELLRKYISLKEAEVRDLRDQQRQYQTFVKKVTSQVDTTSRRNRELLTELEVRKREEGSLRSELRDLKDRHVGELAMQKNEYEDRLRRSGNYDAQAEDLFRKREEWKEKVREELKRIKLKERELETKHELLKRDMQALLDSKDKHVLELKKKNDALELEMESLEDRLRRANTVMAAIDSKKRRLVETMKLAIALLEGIDATEGLDQEEKRRAG